MKVKFTKISEVKLIEPKVFCDDRGFFFESFNAERFQKQVEEEVVFVQDNHSRSVRGVLRGLHYQLPPHAQGKLVRVIQGEVLDIAVDIRKGSSTFGQWVGHVLSAKSNLQIWIPVGFAHGFLTLSDSAELLYKTTDYYAPEYDRSIRWDDPDIGIKWGLNNKPLLSQKDFLAPALHDAEVFEYIAPVSTNETN